MNIEITGLRQTFGGRSVLDIGQFAVDFPSALAFIGPSGGGKSTLLRVLAGLLVPDEGRVNIDGAELERREHLLRAYRKSIGVVFQSFNLFPHLNARENVALPLVHVHGMSIGEATDRANEMLARFGLRGHAEKQSGVLSGGQRQRVALARALAVRPRVLFLDEPTSALDPEMTAEVLGALEEIKATGGRFVIVTHAMGFARRVADRVAFLADGGILESETAESYFSNPRTPESIRFLEKVLKY